MASHHDSHHIGPLLRRPVPLPGELPRVQACQTGQAPLSQLVPGKPYDSYGFISEEQLEFHAPENYIRWVQPIESELDKQVEYDMDAVDAAWLELHNAERAKTGDEPVPPEFFEIVMDRLEKDWFDLNSRIPKPAQEASDGICAICDDGEAEQSNAIVFCDGCNLSVHQDCYGVPYIPADQWLCRKCTVSPNKPVSCDLCPNEGGAFKQTTSGTGWCHLLCALFIPETTVCNSVYMEPIDGVQHIPKGRWKLNCYLCKQRGGACMQCCRPNCYAAFHVTCARDFNLTLELQKGEDVGEHKAFCHRHNPHPQSGEDDSDGAQTPQAQQLLRQSTSSATVLPQLLPPSQLARPVRQRFSPPPPERRLKAASGSAYAKSFVSAGPPIIPEMIAAKVLTWLGQIKLKRKKEALSAICRFWSLKRESRRGAGFLKRLHLEPWTAKAQRGSADSEVGERKLELMKKLRNDLENVRMLCEHVKKRERLKLRRLDEVRRAVQPVLFPMEDAFWEVLDQVGALDKEDLFLEPVSRSVAPDYYDIVKQPVDWLTIGNRIQKHAYLTVDAFKAEVRLVFSNALLYNKPDTPFNRAAHRLSALAEPVLSKLDVWMAPEQQAQQAILLALLTQDRVDALFDLSKDLSLQDNGQAVDLRLGDLVEADAAVPKDVAARRAKNKRQRLAEVKAEQERHAQLQREAYERLVRQAQEAARLAEEERLRVEEQKQLAEEAEARREAEERQRQADEKKQAARQLQEQRKEEKKEKKRIQAEKKDADNAKRREIRRVKREQAEAAKLAAEDGQQSPDDEAQPTTRRPARSATSRVSKPTKSQPQKVPTGLNDDDDLSDLTQLSELSDIDDEDARIASDMVPSSAEPSTSAPIPQTSPRLTLRFSRTAEQDQQPQPEASTSVLRRPASRTEVQPASAQMTVDKPEPTLPPAAERSRKRARSPTKSASPDKSRAQQPAKKKQKQQREQSVEIPDEFQLEEIPLPTVPEGTPAAQKTMLKDLKAKWNCRDRDLRDGDQCWAQVSGFPSWPAQVVLNGRDQVLPAGSNEALTVVFFDDGQQRGSVKPQNLHVLGEDPDFDALMLEYPQLKPSKSKSSSRAYLQIAYKSAKWNWEKRDSSSERPAE